MGPSHHHLQHAQPTTDAAETDADDRTVAIHSHTLPDTAAGSKSLPPDPRPRSPYPFERSEDVAMISLPRHARGYHRTVDATERRAPVRVLLRGVPVVAGRGLSRVIGGHRVMLVSIARGEDWLGVEVRKGDVEGLAWAKAKNANKLIADLLACADVVHACIAPRDMKA